MVAPVVKRIAEEFRGRLITVKVDVDRKQQIAARYGISSIPTLMMFWKGDSVMRLQGAQPYEALKAQIEANWPPGA
jgi:thioredoxin-like negative regulator of GroEL